MSRMPLSPPNPGKSIGRTTTCGMRLTIASTRPLMCDTSSIANRNGTLREILRPPPAITTLDRRILHSAPTVFRIAHRDNGPPGFAQPLHSSDRAQNRDQNHRTDECRNDRADQPTRANAEEAEEPAADEGADHSDDHVADDSVTAAAHHFAREPASDQSNQ